ncbi:phenylacetate-CoA ligase [Candidatus Magnetomoraceae bacterium gMMP-15]
MYDLFSLINKHVIFPLYYLKKRDRRLERLKKIEQNQWFNANELKNLQFQRLKSLICYVYENVEYYKRIFDENNIVPEKLRHIDEIVKIPILTKQLIQENLESMISKKYTKQNLIEDASGGSTGKPTIFFKDRERHLLRRADQIRHDRWCGWDIGEPYAVLWGDVKDFSVRMNFKEWIVSKFIQRSYSLDAFDITEEKLVRYSRELSIIKPTMILAYASAIYLFAQYLKDNPNHGIKPKGIISSAERLSKHKKELIEEVFHCKVLNRYGSREVGLIASECLCQEGLHINADNVFVEIVEGDKPAPIGQSGDIVVTDLWNFGMPLIRYKIEDRGYMKDSLCSCGRKLPLLGEVEGRTSDFLVAEDSTLIHGEFFTHLFYGIEGVKQFQIIQKNMQSVIVKIVIEDNTDKTKFQNIETYIKNSLGKSVNVKIKFTDRIAYSTSGKYLFTISQVKR